MDELCSVTATRHAKFPSGIPIIRPNRIPKIKSPLGQQHSPSVTDVLTNLLNAEDKSNSARTSRLNIHFANARTIRTHPLNILIASFIFILVFSFDDFASALILYCWWRTKIS